MKISTLVVVKVVDTKTLEQLDEAQGPSSGFVVPRVGEFVDIMVNGDPKLFKVKAVGHKYDDTLRNITTLFVTPSGSVPL